MKAPLCADCDGFSLHAGVRVPADERKRLEHLLRYAVRTAIVLSRISLLPDGQVLPRCAPARFALPATSRAG